MNSFLGKKTPLLFLAPMAGFTDKPCRIVASKCGADFVVTELVSSEGLVRSNKSCELMSLDPWARPSGIQLFGSDPETMVKAARIAIETEKPDFIDINAGCPVPKVVKKGGGAALTKNYKLLNEILKVMKSEIKEIPITVKIRIGWDSDSINVFENVELLEKNGADIVFIHGRTRAQLYTGLADWNIIGEVKKRFSVPIVGNGDITSAEIAVRRLQESNCDGLMIGRFALKHPFIFAEIKDLLGRSNGLQIEKTKLAIYNLHYDMIMKHLTNDFYKRIQLRKSIIDYSAGLEGAKQLRKWVFETESLEELNHGAIDFFKDGILPKHYEFIHAEINCSEKITKFENQGNEND